jgi:phosphate-selective porin OprO/OprP
MRSISLVLTVAGLTVAPLRAQEKPADKKTPAVSVGPEGFSIQNERGDFRLQLRGYVNFDGRFYTGDDGGLAVDTFLVRRARPIFQGTVGKYFEFYIAPDFGGGTTVLQDGWADFKPSSKLRVRVGKFKSPVGLERLQSASVTNFVERGLPTALVPNRDVGIQLHGELAGGIVAYAAAVLDGAPDGGSVDGDLNDGKDVAGRLFLSPFKKGSSALKDLGFGIAGITGKQTGVLPAYRSVGQISVVSVATGITADGTRTRYSPQLSFYSGRFGLLAEYASSDSRVKTPDGARQTFKATAWQTTATVALTDDEASYTGVRPRHPFDPSSSQWGALELVARVHGLKLDPDTVSAGHVDPTKSPHKLTGWGIGLNWSLTRNVKQMVNFDHMSFKGGAAAAADRESENVVFIRTQVAF